MNPVSDGDVRYTANGYFQLVQEGLISEDDHVELLEGIIVAEPPQDPPHATSTLLVLEALRNAVGETLVRPQLPLVINEYSVPEPDIAVVSGQISDYRHAHPTTALLLVEVAASSLPKDRLSKSRIYAAAGIPEYWVVNLRDRCVEVFRQPDPSSRQYTDRTTVRRGDHLVLVALPETTVAVDDLLLP